MKTPFYLIATVLFLALASNAFSQKRKVTTAVPKKPVAVAPRVAEAPFDESLMKADRLPSNFVGNNFDLIKALIPSTATAPKGEFESTQAYKERLERVPDTALTGNLKLNSLLAFARTGLGSKYDADSETLTVTIPVGQALLDLFLSRLDSSFRTIVLSRDRQVVGSYVGQNAFGAKKEITKLEEKSRYLVFRNYGSFREYLAKSPYDSPRESEFFSKYDSYQTKDFEFRLALPGAAAEAAKASMSALFIFRLANPYAGVSISRSEPKMDYPTDSTDYQSYLVGDLTQIWLYNRFTGEIYKKIQAKEITSGTLDVKSTMSGGAVLILDRSMKDILAESGVSAIDTFGKTPLHDLYGTLVMALAQQSNPKYSDFIAKVLPNIQKHTKYSVQPSYLSGKIKNVAFGDYYIFGVWNDRYYGTTVWDKPFTMRSEYEEVELKQEDATVKFDDGTRRSPQ